MGALIAAVDAVIKVVFIFGCICGAAATGIVWIAVHVLA